MKNAIILCPKEILSDLPIELFNVYDIFEQWKDHTRYIQEFKLGKTPDSKSLDNFQRFARSMYLQEKMYEDHFKTIQKMMNKPVLLTGPVVVPSQVSAVLVYDRYAYGKFDVKHQMDQEQFITRYGDLSIDRFITYSLNNVLATILIDYTNGPTGLKFSLDTMVSGVNQIAMEDSYDI